MTKDDFCRIPSHPQYFISKDGKIKRMQRHGPDPKIRPNINGEMEVILKEDQTKFVMGGTKFKVKDLIKEAWPQG